MFEGGISWEKGLASRQTVRQTAEVSRLASARQKDGWGCLPLWDGERKKHSKQCLGTEVDSEVS